MERNFEMKVLETSCSIRECKISSPIRIWKETKLAPHHVLCDPLSSLSRFPVAINETADTVCEWSWCSGCFTHLVYSLLWNHVITSHTAASQGQTVPHRGRHLCGADTSPRAFHSFSPSFCLSLLHPAASAPGRKHPLRSLSWGEDLVRCTGRKI